LLPGSIGSRYPQAKVIVSHIMTAVELARPMNSHKSAKRSRSVLMRMRTMTRRAKAATASDQRHHSVT
ncbi:hypothetical protein MCOR12_010081, partial [Pyricularia oryzae]